MHIKVTVHSMHVDDTMYVDFLRFNDCLEFDESDVEHEKVQIIVNV